MSRRVLFSIVVMLALLLGAPARPLSADSGWSEPFPVGDDEFGWFPDVAADAQGGVHVVWGSGANNPNAKPGSPEASLDLLRYRVLRNGAWSTRNDIAFTCYGGYTVRNSIVANANGLLNVLVRTCFNVSAFSAPADRAWSAGAWSRVQRLGTSYYNAVAADSKGTLHALYNEALFESVDGEALLSEIFYRSSTDGGQTWSVRQNIAQLPGGDQRMQIMVDSRDRIHVVWEHGSDWYLALDTPEYGVYRRSDDGGQTWQEATLLGVGDVPIVQATLGLTPDGTPIVVYRSAYDTQIYFQTSPDGGDTWTVAQQIPQVLARDPMERGLDSYSMATDSAGRVHLAVTGYPEQSVAAIPMLLHLVWDGQSWSPPDVISATLNRPMWPRLAVARGNQLHAVWFTYTDASGWGERRAWHSSKMLDVPELPPPPALSLPTVAAATTPAPASTIAPAAGGEAPPVVRAHAPGTPSGATFSRTPPPGVIDSTRSALVPVLAVVPALGLIAAVALPILWRRTRR